MKKRPQPRYQGLSLKKQFGQNILTDQNILKRIAAVVIQEQPDLIVEIGPGTGELTNYLVEHSLRIVLVEIDKDMVARLVEQYKEQDHVTIFCEDARKLDYSRFCKPNCTNVIAGNLPFVSAVHILKQASIFRRLISRLIVMLQREVCDKITAVPGERNFSSLSCYFQYYYTVEHIVTIGKQAFFPSPKVDAAVISLTPISRQDPPAVEKFFERVVHAAFMAPRKKIINSFEQGFSQFHSRASLLDFLRLADISPEVRPSAVTVEQYISLASHLASAAGS